jgi:hypothetical protein
MRRIFHLVIFFTALLVLDSCTKTTTEAQFDDVFKEPYANGIIKFEYEQLTIANGTTSTASKSVSYTSDISDSTDKSEFGYWDPSVPWFLVMRMNKPNDFYHSIAIFFVATNLDSLKFPHTFNAGEIQNAQIDFEVGSKAFYDTQGNIGYGPDTYAASTYDGNFNLTLLSITNNRAQGTFSGIATDQDGFSINITQGLFDVEIVDK